jgi:hypothetical protein
MVKITRFTAVNREEIEDEGVSTTLEAEEAAVIELYESGIRAVLDGKHTEAEVRIYESCHTFDQYERYLKFNR